MAGLLQAQTALADTPSPTTLASGSRTSTPPPTPTPSVSPSASTSPSPTPSPSPSVSPSPSPTADPNQPLYDQLQARLGGDIATGLATQQRLNAALDLARAREQALSAQVDAQAQKISDLQDQIAQLDDQITTTQANIDTEQAQVATLAGAMYRRPNSWVVLIARAGSLREALLEGADLVVAGQRAHALQTKLQADLDKLNADRDARSAELDRETAAKDVLDASLTALDDALTQQQDIANQLLDLLSQLQDALAGLQDQAPADVASLADLLEQQQVSLTQAAYDQAWSQARSGSGRLQILGALPVGQGPKDLKLAWPEPGSPPISQLFGPTDFVLEPPLGQYPHFHTGLDLAAPAGTPVLAAADGVVVAAAKGTVGYGNYIVIAHPGGVDTLYGHLSVIRVAAGDKVKQGQAIGLEGSTGFSTGPHLHFEVRVNDKLLDPLVYLSKSKPVASASASGPSLAPPGVFQGQISPN